MHPSDPAASTEIATDPAARLAAAERALAARDKTIHALVTREKERAARPHSTFGAMEENAALQQVVARKTLELETKNRQLEQTTLALSQSEERMRLRTAALESTANGVLITDLHGTIQWVNRAFTELTGYSAEEAIGQNPRILKSGLHPKSFYTAMWRTIFREGAWRGEIVNRHKHGQLYHEAMTITPVRDDRGATTHYVAIKQDITERKRAEGLLRQSEVRYRSVVDNARAAIFTIAADGTFTSLNPAVETLTGIVRAEWIGRPFAPLIHPADLPLAMEMFTRALQTDQAPVHEWRSHPGLSKAALMEIVLTAQKDENGRAIGVLGIGRDITERRRAEIELAELHRQLLVTSRQAGMAEVATSVLHNVGNVLNSVNVSATLVAEHVRHSKAGNIAKLAEMFSEHRTDLATFLTQDPRGRMVPDYLGTLRDTLAEERKKVTAELDHLRKNIEHIKDVVAMQQNYAKTSGFVETVPLAELVEDALRMNAGSPAREDLEFVRDFQGAPTVATDKHKVMQILVNLVGNAKHACDASGRADKRIVVRIASDAQAVQISVGDNGVGIPVENLTRIFAHGFTTKPDGHGFGLHSGALAAKELGGSLRVQSDGPGFGATFVLELPLKPEGAAQENAVR